MGELSSRFNKLCDGLCSFKRTPRDSDMGTSPQIVQAPYFKDRKKKNVDLKWFTPRHIASKWQR